jgi:hypothetical protein
MTATSRYSRSSLRCSGTPTVVGLRAATQRTSSTPSRILRQVDAEVGQRQVGDGDAGGQVFQVDDRVLELEQLLAPVLQVVHLVAGLLLDQVLLARGRDVEQHHAAADALLQVDVLLQLHVGPEVDELDAFVGEPIRSMRPKRWMMRTGFQWMS